MIDAQYVRLEVDETLHEMRCEYMPLERTEQRLLRLSRLTDDKATLKVIAQGLASVRGRTPK